MNFRSFSKINLSLNINKRLKNGLHDLQSHFCLIDIFDEIKIKKSKKLKDEVKFFGKYTKNIDKNDNTIIKTLKFLRKEKLILNFYSVSIKKKIPIYAGLGGGTGNAVYLAKYLLNNKINKKTIDKMKKYIGSDCLLFLHKQGFLESLDKIKIYSKTHKLFFLLVYPNIKCSTKHVYSKVKNFSPKIKLNYIIRKSKKNYINFLTKSKNDLQLIVEKEHSIIRDLLLEIRQHKGCYFSRMTGSGSVCYGVFQSKKSVIAALNKIKSKHPSFWTTFAKTI